MLVRELGQTERSELKVLANDGAERSFYSSGRSDDFNDEYYIAVSSNDTGEFLFSTYHYDDCD